MEIELFEIKNHIFRFPPFRELPETRINALVHHIEIAYFRSGTRILEHGQKNTFLHFIRSGAVEIRRSNGDFFNRIGEGDVFGQFALLQGKPVRYPAKAIEDTLLYLIPNEQFQLLCEAFDHFSDFMIEDNASRLQTAISHKRHGIDNPLLTTPVHKLISKKLVSAGTHISIQDAAGLMSDQHVSALILKHDTPEATGYEIAGIFTDRDLRKRAVAKGFPLSTPVSEVMTAKVIAHGAEDYAFEALLSMIRHNVHHIPILRGQSPIGVISASDLVRHESHGTVYLIDKIFKQESVAALSREMESAPLSYAHMVNGGANSHMVGSAFSGIGLNISQRLLQLGEKQLGPPPVPYCYITMGSMARDEQLIVSDQDNAFILDNSFIPERHDGYFLRLATFVSDGLARCGYEYCKGDIMGTNGQWRQPLDTWKGLFTGWIEAPDPAALLNASIFFDFRGVYGDLNLAAELMDLVLHKARQSLVFLDCLAGNALLRTPPLGFFRQFVLEPDGAHKDTFNLKRRGTAPLTDMVRVHALACGSKSLNTRQRLDDINRAGLLPEGYGNDLKDAFEFIAITKIRHQAKQIEAGEKPDNSISPQALSSFERRHLKDAFLVISNQQGFLRHKYRNTLTVGSK